MKLVIFGNPVDGFRFYGPFKGVDEAIKWAENQGSADWWLGEVTEPEFSPSGMDEG